MSVFPCCFRPLAAPTTPRMPKTATAAISASATGSCPAQRPCSAGLAPRFRLYLASNGVADTQYSRLESAGISHFFQEIFISGRHGFHKPEKGYFDYCFARIPDFDPAMAMIVGDSLTSDILGGRNAGLRTCWFNRAGRPPRPDIVPDFEIHRLEELPDILEQC